MEEVQKMNKVKVIPTSLPYEINLNDNGKKLVKWKNQEKANEFGQDGRLINPKILEVFLNLINLI